MGLVLIIVGFSLIFVDNVSAGINDYYADVNKSKEIMFTVFEDYVKFENGAIDIKNEIVDVSKALDIYLEDFPIKESLIVEKINIVENDINNINLTSLELINMCKYDLNNNSMNSKCNNFKKNYVRMIDSYKKMIIVYNDVLNSYNEFIDKKVFEEYVGKVDYAVYELIK